MKGGSIFPPLPAVDASLEEKQAFVAFLKALSGGLDRLNRDLQNAKRRRRYEERKLKKPKK